MNRRKTLYVSRVVQGRILSRTLLYVLGYTLLVWHVMFLCAIQGNPPHRTLGQMYVNFCIDNAWLMVFFAVLTPMFIFGMLKMTHAVVGPLVPMERALRAMTRGERVEPRGLRKGDLLGQFNDVFNECVAAHNRRLEQTADPERPRELVECQ